MTGPGTVTMVPLTPGVFGAVPSSGSGGVIDITDPQYGAVVGLNSSDAINAAISDASAVGGKEVLVPAGTFLIDKPIRLQSNVILTGAGLRSKLQAINSYAYSEIVTLDDDTVIQTLVRDLFIDGNKANQSGAVAGFSYQAESGNPFHTIERCRVDSCSGKGLDIAAQHTVVENVFVWSCDGIGVYINTPDCKLDKVRVGNAGLEGIQINGSNTEMVGVGVWGSGQVTPASGTGIRVTASLLKAANCETADSATHGWSLESVFHCSIVGGQSEENNNGGVGAGAAFRISGGGRHFIKSDCGGGGRSVESSLLQFDTDGASYPHYCRIELSYTTTSGAIGANAEMAGTVASDNTIRINERIVSGGLTFSSVNSSPGLAMTGTFPVSVPAIDFRGGTFGSSGQIRMAANQAGIVGRKNDDSGDLELWRMNSNNENEFRKTLRFQDAVDIGFGLSTGTKIGILTTHLLGFHGATPSIQRASANQAAVDTTTPTNSSPYGFTLAQATAIITLVNELRAALVEKGLIKGSA